ncbi:hypothetical protein ABMA27_003049 [Loxostege sticticalis]|uniref:DDE Tnp4 domain-containing protein n=1 Tax=Loxostege sticticalis TaxID=481309 RepID=A0ABR3HRS2_LOXSC
MSSSSDEEIVVMYLYLRQRRRRKRRTMWIHPYIEKNINCRMFVAAKELQESDRKILDCYRMSKTTYLELVEIMTPQLQKQNTNMRECVSPQERLLITLMYLGGTSSTYVALGLYFARGESTIASIWKRIAERYYTLWNMPNCLGSIDGKRIRILKKILNTGSTNFNYKNYHSIILMACADADSLFTMIEVGCAGRNSDAGIFRVSSMKRLIEEDALNIPAPGPLPMDENNFSFPFYFVGDEAFPLEKYSMRPFLGRTATNTSRIFNYRLSRARKSVEWLFWHVVNNIIKSACVLHNFVRSKEGIPYHTTIVGNGISQRPTDLMPHDLTLGPNPSPLSLRKYLNNYFFTPQTALPWQWAYCV